MQEILNSIVVSVWIELVATEFEFQNFACSIFPRAEFNYNEFIRPRAPKQNFIAFYPKKIKYIKRLFLHGKTTDPFQAKINPKSIRVAI